MPKNNPTSFFTQLIQRLVKNNQGQRKMELCPAEMLLIGCVDARLNPHEDICIPDGAALTYRNIGAQISGASDNHDEAHIGEEAALEYAIKVKGVHDIVVMGHTHCGGIGTCCGAHHHEHESPIPHIDAYMKPVADACRDIIDNKNMSEDQKRRAMEKAAVEQSIANLKTYPWLEKLVNLPDSDPNKVRLRGWVIDTTTKVIAELDESNGTFVPMKPKADEPSTTFQDIRKLNEERIAVAPPPNEQMVPEHHPKALIVGGIDERVTAHTLGIKHGEALLYRNPTAYMPGTNDPKGNHNLSAAAVIEFATKVMKVPDIIVLGHRDSGGIKTILEDEKGKKIDPHHVSVAPNIIKYLSSLLTGLVLPKHDDEKAIAQMQHDLEEIAVRKSIENIKTYDGVRELIASGKLHVRGAIIDPRDHHVEVLEGDKFVVPTIPVRTP